MEVPSGLFEHALSGKAKYMAGFVQTAFVSVVYKLITMGKKKNKVSNN